MASQPIKPKHVLRAETRRATIMRLAQSTAGIESGAVRDALNCSNSVSSHELWLLTQLGLLHSTTQPGTRRLRWFASKEAMAAWIIGRGGAAQVQNKQHPRTKARLHSPSNATGNGRGAPPPKSRAVAHPVTGNTRWHAPSGEAIIPAAVRVQRLPSATHDERFQVAPELAANPRMRPAGFGAGIANVPIGHDPMTGLPWGARP